LLNTSATASANGAKQNQPLQVKEKVKQAEPILESAAKSVILNVRKRPFFAHVALAVKTKTGLDL